MNFEILRQKRERDELLKLNKGCIGKFWIRTIWIYLSDWAVNAAIRWFNGKGGKGDYGWLQGDVVMFESHFVAACTGTMYLFEEFEELVEQIKIMMMGEMRCWERVVVMRCSEWWASSLTLLPITHLADISFSLSGESDVLLNLCHRRPLLSMSFLIQVPCHLLPCIWCLTAYLCHRGTFGLLCIVPRFWP